MSKQEYRIKIRLFLASALSPAQIVGLDDAQIHYLHNVMRLEKGAVISVFNGKDGEWLAELQKNQVQIQSQTRQQNSTPDVMLVFAPVKKDETDFIIQKSTELGVSHIQPVYTDFTNSQRFNMDRALAHSIEAAEQSHRLSVPTLSEPQKLSDLLHAWPDDRILIFCDELRQAKPIAQLLPELRGQKIAFLIGPEGGFSAAERQALHAHKNVRSVHLGPRILRAETAAIAALTVYQALLGDWQNSG